MYVKAAYTENKNKLTFGNQKVIFKKDFYISYLNTQNKWKVTTKNWFSQHELNIIVGRQPIKKTVTAL